MDLELGGPAEGDDADGDEGYAEEHGGRRYSGFGSLAWLGEEADFSLRYQSRKAPQRRTKRIMPIPGSSQLLSQLSC